MKKFLALALALIMVLALAACDEKTSTPSDSSDPGTSQQTEQPSNTPDASTPSDSNNDSNSSLQLDNTYTDAQLSYIDTLGKTTDGEKLVCYYEDYGGLSVYVVEWSKSENKASSILKYVFHTKEDMYSTDRDMTKGMTHYVEHADDIMMVCTDLSDTLSSQADACTSFEQIAADVLGGATILK